MAKVDPFRLVSQMRVDSLRVHAPTKVVFLCGGLCDATSESPISLRDAFYREATGQHLDFDLVLAEDAKPLTAEAGYKDLLKFESDIAQVVGLIVLFSESAGSMAELGAFAAMPTISPSLLAVLDDFYYDRSSFIRNGPILYLENEHGDEWISVLERAMLGIGSDGEIDQLSREALYSAVSSSIDIRLSAQPKWRKLNPESAGHTILAMVGLCQEFGALTKSELKENLRKVGLDPTRMDNFLYCALFLKWIKRIRKGHNVYFAATGGDLALDYVFGEGVEDRDKLRRRSDIRKFWQESEPARMRAIAEALAGTGGI